MPENNRSTWNWRSRRIGGRLLRMAAPSLTAAVLAACGATERDGAQTNGPSDQGFGGTSGGSGPDKPVGGDGGRAAAPTRIDLAGAPRYYRFVRLTNAQWAGSVQEVLRLEEPPSDLAATFESPVAGVSDFSNNEHLLDVDARRWDSFQTAAEELAARATASEAALSAVYPGTDVDGFIEAVGRRAYSRPLTPDEVSDLRDLFDAGAAMSGSGSTFAKGAALVLRGLLQSPYFLYRSELGETGAPLSGYEAAAKLSLWLRGATPNDSLLDIAPTLTTADAIEEQARDMLEGDAARAVMRQFHDEYLHLSRFEQLMKVGVASYDPALNLELRESSSSFFDQLFQRGGGLREMLTSTRGFVGPGLAPLYQIDAPASGLVEADLGARRAGWFSQVPFLALYGHNEEPDTFRRGIFLALDLLCSTLGPALGEIPPWPAALPGQTNRDRITAGTAKCGGACHNELINPLGFAFEHFDGMGRYRDVEVHADERLPIDSSGSFQFDDGKRDFADNVELMNAIANSSQTHLCYAKKVASFSLQRDIVAADLPWLNELASVSRSSGSLKRTLLDLARSDAFRTHVGATP